MYGLRGDGWEDATMHGADNTGELTGFTSEAECSVAIDGGRMDDHEATCPECNAHIEDDALSFIFDPEDEAQECVDGHDEDCTEPSWRPPRTIGRYFNAAGVTVDEEQNRVQLWVSVGDPRGAFVMNLEMVETDSGPELRLSVPTPEDGMLHVPLTPLASPGYYRVGA